MIEEHDRHDELKRLIESKLLNEPQSTIQHFFASLEEASRKQQIDFDFPTAIEYWWHLARIGAIALPGAEITTVMVDHRASDFAVTSRGKKLLERGERSPHDPQKYMLALKRRVPAPDSIALTYLDEAVGAWRAGLYRSSTVMLGCACERLVLLLAEAVRKAGGKHASKVSKLIESVPIRISQLFDAIRDSLLQLEEPNKLPGNLAGAGFEPATSGL